jgi:ankyrin repeat protein
MRGIFMLLLVIILCFGFFHNQTMICESTQANLEEFLQEKEHYDMDNSESLCGRMREFVINHEFAKFIDLAVIADPIECRSKKGTTLLHIASAWDNELVIKTLFLQAKKMDVDITDSNSDTSLHYASILGKHRAIALLLTKGANPLAVNHRGKTPRQTAEKFAKFAKSEDLCENFQETIRILEKAELSQLTKDHIQSKMS